MKLLCSSRDMSNNLKNYPSWYLQIQRKRLSFVDSYFFSTAELHVSITYFWSKILLICNYFHTKHERNRGWLNTRYILRACVKCTRWKKRLPPFLAVRPCSTNPDFSLGDFSQPRPHTGKSRKAGAGESVTNVAAYQFS